MPEFSFAMLVGMTIGLTETFKFNLEGNAARALGVVVGFVLGLATELVKATEITLQVGVASGLYGLMIGLTSVGLYHATTATAKKIGVSISERTEVADKPVEPTVVPPVEAPAMTAGGDS